MTVQICVQKPDISQLKGSLALSVADAAKHGELEKALTPRSGAVTVDGKAAAKTFQGQSTLNAENLASPNAAKSLRASFTVIEPIVKEEVDSRFNSPKLLENFLIQGGIDTSKFGQNGVQTVECLFYELQDGEASIQCDEKTGEITRCCEIVFIHIRYGTKLLVMKEQLLETGQKKASTARVVIGKKGPGDNGVYACALRAIENTLGIPARQLEDPEAVKYREDLYGFEIETMFSTSFPGLKSFYRTHYTQFNILEKGVGLFEQCGLPEATDFDVELVSRLGTKIQYFSWMEVADCRRMKIKKFPPMGSAAQVDEDVLDVSTIKTEQDLKLLLERDGVDTSKFGVDKAKDLGALLKEINEGSSKLETGPSGRIQRTVEPVFVQVCFRDLVLVEKLQILEDGRERKRNMVLAEKREPGDRNLFHTALRGIEEELHVPECELNKPDRARFLEDTYCMMLETTDSKSYPGIQCVYRTHYVQIELLEGCLPLFQSLGLPTGEEFHTEEQTKKGTKKFTWSWTNFQKAYESKVKGILTDATAGVPQPDYKKATAWVSAEPIEIESPEALSAFLIQGGVDILSKWSSSLDGKLLALLQELRLELCTLEKNMVNGQVRRVLKPAFISVKQQGGILVASDKAVSKAPNPRESHTWNNFLEAERGTDYFDKLGVTLNHDDTDGVCYRSDLKCFETNSNQDSSFPDLKCIQRTNRVNFC